MAGTFKPRVFTDAPPDWVAAMERSLSRTITPPPPEFKSISQLTEMFKRSPATMRTLMMQMIEAGEVERKLFPVMTACGRVQNLPHFRLLKKGKSNK